MVHHGSLVLYCLSFFKEKCIHNHIIVHGKFPFPYVVCAYDVWMEIKHVINEECEALGTVVIYLSVIYIQTWQRRREEENLSHEEEKSCRQESWGNMQTCESSSLAFIWKWGSMPSWKKLATYNVSMLNKTHLTLEYKKEGDHTTSLKTWDQKSSLKALATRTANF